MNNDIIGKEVVFYENNTWNHIIKEINLYTYTIEYGIKSGFSDKEQAEQSYFFFNEKFQKDIERIKRLTNIQYTFTEYLDFWMKNLYLPYSDSSAKVGYSWTIYQIILPKVKRDVLLGMVTTKFLDDLIDECDGYSKCSAAMAYKVIHLALTDALNDGYLKNDPLPGVKKRYWNSPKITILTKEQVKIFLAAAKEYHSIYLEVLLALFCGLRKGDDDDKIRLNQRKPSKYKGLRRFGPEKNLQRINKFMKERPTFYKKLIQMKENIRFYLRCFYCITKVVILQFNSEKQDRISS